MNTKNEKHLIYILLGLIASMALIPFINTGIATGDDAEFFITGFFEKLNASSAIYAKGAGRFYFYITKPFYNIPYLIHNLSIIKAINILFVLVNIIIINKIIGYLSGNKKVGWLFFVLAITFITVKGQNNPITAFHWYFTGSINFILVSLLYALKFRKENKRSFKYFAIISYAIGLIFYEVYLLYLPVIIFTIHQFNFKQQNIRQNIVSFLKNTYPLITIGLLYITVYFSFRIFFPPNYAGTSVSNQFKITDGINTMISMARGSYPCFYFFFGKRTFWETSPFLTNHIQNIAYPFTHTNYLWYVKAIIVGSLSVQFVNYKSNLKIKNLIIPAIVAYLYIYIPHIPLALTEKYTYQYPGADFYITTFFGFFALIFSLTIVFSSIALVKNKVIKYTLTTIMVLIVSTGSILTDYINHHAVKDLQQPLNTLNCFNEFLETQEFQSIPENSFIYAPNLYKNSTISYMYSQNFRWGEYSLLKAKKNLHISKSKDELIKAINNNETNIYYLKYDYNRKDIDRVMVLGRISGNSIINEDSTLIMADSVTCFYYSSQKEFTISFGFFDNEIINNYFSNGQNFISNKSFAHNHYRYHNFRNYFKPIKIKAQNIDINSIRISPLIGIQDSEEIIIH